jgi:hypothetical protein
MGVYKFLESGTFKLPRVGYKSMITKFDHKQAVAVFKSHTFDGDLQRIKKNGPTLPEKKKKMF